MYFITDPHDLAHLRHGELLKEADNRRLIREARKARYARSGNGYRLIAAGQRLFESARETTHAA